MYVSPNHPNPPRPAAPPEDTSTRLIVFPRPNGEEVRLGISQFNNRYYLRAQMWAENERGEMWPLRGRSITWRADELGELIAALRSAETILERGHVAPPDDRPTYVNKGRHRGRAQLFRPGDLAARQAGSGEAFDETAAGGR